MAARLEAVTAPSSELTNAQSFHSPRVCVRAHVQVTHVQPGACPPRKLPKTHELISGGWKDKSKEGFLHFLPVLGGLGHGPSLWARGKAPTPSAVTLGSESSGAHPWPPRASLTRMLFTMAAVLLSAASGFPMRKSQAQNTRQQKA